MDTNVALPMVLGAVGMLMVIAASMLDDRGRPRSGSERPRPAPRGSGSSGSGSSGSGSSGSGSSGSGSAGSGSGSGSAGSGTHRSGTAGSGTHRSGTAGSGTPVPVAIDVTTEQPAVPEAKVVCDQSDANVSVYMLQGSYELQPAYVDSWKGWLKKVFKTDRVQWDRVTEAEGLFRKANADVAAGRRVLIIGHAEGCESAMSLAELFRYQGVRTPDPKYERSVPNLLVVTLGGRPEVLKEYDRLTTIHYIMAGDDVPKTVKTTSIQCGPSIEPYARRFLYFADPHAQDVFGTRICGELPKPTRMYECDVVGDGNCFFHAIYVAHKDSYGDPPCPTKLRTMFAKAIEEPQKEFKTAVKAHFGTDSITYEECIAQLYIENDDLKKSEPIQSFKYVVGKLKTAWIPASFAEVWSMMADTNPLFEGMKPVVVFNGVQDPSGFRKDHVFLRIENRHYTALVEYHPHDAIVTPYERRSLAKDLGLAPFDIYEKGVKNQQGKDEPVFMLRAVEGGGPLKQLVSIKYEQMDVETVEADAIVVAGNYEHLTNKMNGGGFVGAIAKAFDQSDPILGADDEKTKTGWAIQEGSKRRKDTKNITLAIVVAEDHQGLTVPSGVDPFAFTDEANKLKYKKLHRDWAEAVEQACYHGARKVATPLIGNAIFAVPAACPIDMQDQVKKRSSYMSLVAIALAARDAVEYAEGHLSVTIFAPEKELPRSDDERMLWTVDYYEDDDVDDSDV